MKQVVLKTAYLFLIGFVATNFACSSHAQEPTRYIPKTAFATMTIRLGLIEDSDSLKLVPYDEVLSKVFAREGIDYRKVKTVTYVLARSPNDNDVITGMIIEFKEKIDAVEYFRNQHGSVEVVDIDGTKIIRISDADLFAIQETENRLIVSGKETFALNMSASKNEKTDFIKLLKNKESESLCRVRIITKPIDDWFPTLDQTTWESLSNEDQFNQIISGESLIRTSDSITLDFDWSDDGIGLDLKLITANPDDAKKLRKKIESMLEVVEKTLAAMERAFDTQNLNMGGEAAGTGWVRYSARIARYARKNLKPTVKGQSVIVQHRDKNGGSLASALVTLFALQEF